MVSGICFKIILKGQERVGIKMKRGWPWIFVETRGWINYILYVYMFGIFYNKEVGWGERLPRAVAAVVISIQQTFITFLALSNVSLDVITILLLIGTSWRKKLSKSLMLFLTQVLLPRVCVAHCLKQWPRKSCPCLLLCMGGVVGLQSECGFISKGSCWRPPWEMRHTWSGFSWSSSSRFTEGQRAQPLQGLPLLPRTELRLPWWHRWWRICLQYGRLGFCLWVGKTPERRKWQPTPVFLLGESPWEPGEEPGGLQSMESESWTQLSTQLMLPWAQAGEERPWGIFCTWCS